MKEQKVEQLIELCVRGDKHAWDEFIQRFGGMIFGIVRYGFRFQDELAEEITQEIYIDILNKLPELNHESITAFIQTRTRCKCIDSLRKRNAAKRGGGAVQVSLDDEYEDGAARYEVPDDSFQPELELQKKELVLQLRRTVRELGEVCQKLIQLKYLEELTLAQIAKMLREKEDAITTRLYRCLNELRTLMQEMKT